VITFNSAVAKIRREHDRLGHNLGWRFLYSPRRTFASSTRIVFIGQNPGGCRCESPVPSVENGNAYRVEPWNKPYLNALQKQVCAFYWLISRVLPGNDMCRLMDDTLAANFCPFRSPSWNQLRKKEESLRFSRKLWRDIFRLLGPEVIVTLSYQVRDEIDQLFRGIERPRSLSCRWRSSAGGILKYRLAYVRHGGKRVLLIGLPHLSRFKIFDRKRGNLCFDPLVRAVKRQLG